MGERRTMDPSSVRLTILTGDRENSVISSRDLVNEQAVLVGLCIGRPLLGGANFSRYRVPANDVDIRGVII